MSSDVSLVRRMVGAATFDVDLYEEVEYDRQATVQAALVVGMATLAQAVGAGDDGWMEVARAAVGALFGFLVFAGLAYLIGARLFGGQASWGEVWRTVGFAQSPAVLGVFGLAPLVGWLVDAVVVMWVLWASIVALRQALDIDTLRAVITGILAGAVWASLSLVL